MLSILWDLEPEEVEDILEEFVNKSLLFVDSHNKPYLYYLHDLQLDFLVEQNRTQLEVGSQTFSLFVKFPVFGKVKRLCQLIYCSGLTTAKRCW